MLRLTFDQNKFVLHGVNIIGREWSRNSLDSYWTTDIKAAVRFRDYADARAEKIFSKLMLRRIAFPTGGVLFPRYLPLYPFQETRGVPHILQSNRSYLAHEPGLGKSAQCISAVSSKPGRTVIVAPSFLKLTWAREITKWFIKDFPRIEIVPETAKQLEMDWLADFIIVSDAMIIKEWVMAGLRKQKFRFFFIDEAHRYKTADASRSVALLGGKTEKIKSPGLVYNSEHVCALSGTPVLNRPIELWPILYALAPETIDFMPYQDFGFHFGGAVQDERGRWRFVGSANEAELNGRIMGRFMQRITKAEVLPDLPEKVREVILIDQDPRSKDVKALDMSLMKKLKSSDFERPTALGEYAILCHENGLAKVKWASEFVADIMSEDPKQQIILFAHHRDVVDKLREALTKFAPMVINGGIDMEKRTKIEDLFQSGRRRLLIGNIDAMNLGITLTKATRVIFAEYSWTPSANLQAEDRAHRIGQHDSVFCQYLVLPNSIDEVKLNSLLAKQDRIKKIMGD